MRCKNDIINDLKNKIRQSEFEEFFYSFRCLISDNFKDVNRLINFERSYYATEADWSKGIIDLNQRNQNLNRLSVNLLDFTDRHKIEISQEKNLKVTSKPKDFQIHIEDIKICIEESTEKKTIIIKL